MVNAPQINGLHTLANNYDALLCDAWGVIHDGVRLMKGAEEALLKFREQCGPVIIITNAPRPSSVIPAQLTRLGLAEKAYDRVITSGDATRMTIERRLPAPAFKIGPDKDDPLFDGLDLSFSTLEDAEFIICTGLRDDRREEPEAYREVLTRAAARKLEMICANPDIVVNLGGRLIWCAGALAKLYEELGGAVIYSGKPHAPIYALAFGAVDAARGAPTDRARILAVGDSLSTDIAGAARAGIDAILVTGDGGVYDSADASPIRKALGVMERLHW